MYAILLIIFLILSINFSIKSVHSAADDGFFVVPEDKFFNPEDYDGKSALSSELGNSSAKIKTENESNNTNDRKITDSINFTVFNFALAGDWGYEKYSQNCKYDSKT